MFFSIECIDDEKMTFYQLFNGIYPIGIVEKLGESSYQASQIDFIEGEIIYYDSGQHKSRDAAQIKIKENYRLMQISKRIFARKIRGQN